ncbi:nuclear transport factor 2 family protein [Sphingomonas sp. CL5.1]|uniref:nuclear transport factor 2 family protein n=1 Tax=Sphingomonas sp. CL5.1 TaxID=2653203 RepID=UPI001583F668|nr:nuclear transport factor 2 family protein [Sphingomonas sp. CL5.1]QKS00093.1 nuclear transport factor 2 family protein [Sphingomonas sp. CL5.1]
MDTIALLKRIYAHDREALYGNMRPDFTVHSPGQNLIAGTYVGPEAFKAHMAKMQSLCGNTFREELQDTFLANDTWGLVVHRMTAERNGKRLDTWGFGLWRFEDGKLTDHWESVGDQAHWDDFWS